MGNRFLVGVITFFCAIIFSIIFLNTFDSSSKKKYFFERNFNDKSILNFEKRHEKINNTNNEDKYVRYIKSDNLLVEQDKKIIGDINNEHEIYFSDLAFKSKFSKNAILPKNANILFCDTNRLFYTSKFELFEYDFATKISKKIWLDNFKAFSLKLIPKHKNKFLCFGESFKNNTYKTGFYIIDIVTNELKLSKVLQYNNKTAMPENALVYSGGFTKTFEHDKIIYYCDKYSKIYFFDNDGLFVKEFTTKDNVPLPEILTNQKGDSFYSRGGTWTSNTAMFMKGNKIFVFSSRSDDNSSIIIDQYSYNTLQYVQSFKLKYNNLNSNHIMDVFIDKDKIILGFEFYYASFTFSRYI